MRRLLVGITVLLATASTAARAEGDPPANDDIASAEALAVPSRTLGSTANATMEPEEVAANCPGAATRSVWYRLDVEHPTPISVHTEALEGTGAITVYRGPASSLSLVACHPSPGTHSFVGLPGSYFLRVASTDVAHAFELSIGYGTDANAPLAGGYVFTDGRTTRTWTHVCVPIGYSCALGPVTTETSRDDEGSFCFDAPQISQCREIPALP